MLVFKADFMCFLKEAPVKSGLNVSRDKMFGFKAKIVGNRPLFTKFARQKPGILTSKNNS